MSGLKNREQLAESFNEVLQDLQVLDKELIGILFRNRDLKGKEDKFLYLQYTDVDVFTLYYDDELGDGLNVELFKLSIEDFLSKGIILTLMVSLNDKLEEALFEANSKLIDLINIELDIEIDRVRSNKALEKLLLDKKKQGVN